ncbi:MAG: hypothetical protein J7M15_00015 [Anaerolineae bacterium]|nr:hypothetical protein [Anaerolineae bacterium]
MNVGRILSRAWQITWRHKILWIYGILLALCGAGTTSVSPRPGAQYTLNQSDLQFFQRRLPIPPWLPHGTTPFGNLDLWNWRALAGSVALLVIILLFVFLVLAIARVIVHYTSLGALVHMVDETEETDTTTFKAGLKGGWRNLLKLLAIDILVGLASLLAALVIVAIAVLGLAFAVGPAIALANAGRIRVLAILWAILAGLGVLGIVSVLAIAVNAPITIIRQYSYRFSVLDRANVFDAIGHAYQLLRERSRSSVSVWLVMIGISLALGLLLAPLAMVIMMAIASGAWMTFGRPTGSTFLGLIVAVPIVLIVTVLVTLVTGIYNVFGSAVWTLAYRELAQTPVKGI